MYIISINNILMHIQKFTVTRSYCLDVEISIPQDSLIICSLLILFDSKLLKSTVFKTRPNSARFHNLHIYKLIT